MQRYLFTLAFFLFSLSTWGLNGKVTDTNSNPIPGATITIVDNRNPQNNYVIRTDNDGQYNISIHNSQFKGIKEGQITIDPLAKKVIIDITSYAGVDVEISLFDILGSRVTGIINQNLEIGNHSFTWDYSAYKQYMENKVFFIAIRTGNDFITKKFILSNNTITQNFYAEIIDLADFENGNIPPSSYRIIISENDFEDHIIHNIDLANKQTLDIVINKDLWIPFKCQGKYLAQYNGDSYRNLFIKGVNLGSGIPGSYPSQMAASASQYAKWFELMSNAGFNLIRVYTLHYPRFYKELKKFNENHPENPLYVLHGAWLDEEYEGFETNPDLFQSTITFLPDWNEGTQPRTMSIMDYFDDRVSEMIDVVHGNATLPNRPGWASGDYTADISPWLIGYIIGREIYPVEVLKTNQNEENQDYTYLNGDVFNLASGTPSEIWAAQRLDNAMMYEKETYQQQHPISFSSWPSLDPIEHPTETGSEDMVAINLDEIEETNAPAGYFASYHVYPYFPDFMVCDPGYRSYTDEFGENSYLGYLYDLKSHYANRPLIISEFGVSSGWGTSRFSTNGMHHGGLTEKEQGEYIIRMMHNIKNSGCGGGMLFSWMDEWFKYIWIFGQTTNPHSRPRWHNILSAEENYGLLTFIPEDPDFSEYGFLSHSVDISQGRIAYDTEGFYIKTKLNSPFDTNDTLWIAIDTYHKGKGESILPNGKLIYNRAEFCLSVTNANAQLYVTKAYNMFGIGQEGFPTDGQYFRSVASDKGNWVPVKWRNHRDDDFCAGNIFETGQLKIRTNKTPTRHDAVIIDDNIVIVKLPWALINFNDPSQLEVTHITDYSKYGNNFTQTLESDGIAVTIYNKNSRLTIPRFTWEKWDEYHMPLTKEYKKSSYYIVKKGLKQFEQYPVD